MSPTDGSVQILEQSKPGKNLLCNLKRSQTSKPDRSASHLISIIQWPLSHYLKCIYMKTYAAIGSSKVIGNTRKLIALKKNAYSTNNIEIGKWLYSCNKNISTCAIENTDVKLCDTKVSSIQCHLDKTNAIN